MSKLPRYGLEWKSDTDFVATPMTDGYWTPWHISDAEIARLQSENEALKAQISEMEADDNALDKMRGAFILRQKANTVEECFMIAEEAISVEWLLGSLADYQLHLTKKANEIENQNE